MRLQLISCASLHTRGQVATTAACVVGQAQVIATSVCNGSLMAQMNPLLGAEFKPLIKDSSSFIGVAKGEDALRTKVIETPGCQEGRHH